MTAFNDLLDCESTADIFDRVICVSSTFESSDANK